MRTFLLWAQGTGVEREERQGEEGSAVWGQQRHPRPSPARRPRATPRGRPRVCREGCAHWEMRSLAMRFGFRDPRRPLLGGVILAGGRGEQLWQEAGPSSAGRLRGAGLWGERGQLGAKAPPRPQLGRTLRGTFFSKEGSPGMNSFSPCPSPKPEGTSDVCVTSKSENLLHNRAGGTSVAGARLALQTSWEP